MFNLVKKIFGSGNKREISRIKKTINIINDLEDKYSKLNVSQLKDKFEEFKNKELSPNKLDDVLPDIFAIGREVSKTVLGLRPFDVQLIGGIVLHEGKIAEMKTGEGKTLVATLPVILNSLIQNVHLITVNDYLARRDARWMGPIYLSLGLRVGILNTGKSYEVIYENANYEIIEVKRSDAYKCDIIYGTNSEFGFDYLRDNMKYTPDEICQKNHFFAIVDEVDSILIDEARTPLIISGPTDNSLVDYKKINAICKQLNKDDIVLDEKSKQVFIQDSGTEKLQSLLAIENLYDPQNLTLLHSVNQSLRAINLYEKNKDYVIQENKVVIVDEFTGRMMPSRRWSDGLHQAVEAKENVDIEEENQTLASITIQNYFRMYQKLAGMTGTADTEALEFQNIYKLKVVVIPTNVEMARKDLNDLIYRTEKEKFLAIVNEIKNYNSKGNPVLIGTISVEKSEALSKELKKLNISHNVLNAKNHEQEAEIIQNAGKFGSVTIATNMAGRGTDIKLGGESSHDKDKILNIGGLIVLGSERHESRRIDNQLRGRSGRQGDPGVTQFFVSMEDELMRLFGSERISSMMGRLGWEEGEPIEHKMITGSLENAQKKVEARNFEIRKHLLEYDDVQNKQREVIYKIRNKLLRDSEVDQVLENIKDEILDSISYAFQQDNETSVEQIFSSIGLMDKSLDINSLEEFDFYLISKINDKKKTLGEMYEPIAKLVLISSLDMTWKDHLLSMDYLRESVSLRGYAQQNPLNEYKKEGYEMFENMLDNFNYEAFRRFLEVVPITDDEIKEIEKTKDNNKDLSYTDDTAIEDKADEIKNDPKQIYDKKLSQARAKNKRRDLEKQKRKQRKKQRR